MPDLRPLASVKGSPEQMRPTVECFREIGDSTGPEFWSRLSGCLGPRLLRLPTVRSSRRPKVENLISAQALPTAARLGIIEGYRTDWRLTYNGHRLSEATDDEGRFRTRLGKILLGKDKAEYHIIDAIAQAQAYPGAAVKLEDIALRLALLGVDPMEDFNGLGPADRAKFEAAGIQSGPGERSRLSDLLKFYNWADIVRTRAGTATLLVSRIGDIEAEELESPRGTVSIGEFYRVLRRTYSDLARDVYRNPFVPLKPRLLQAVCLRLKIGEGYFAELLSELPPSLNRDRILLSPYKHRRPMSEVVTIGKRQYYFLSIFSEDVQEDAV